MAEESCYYLNTGPTSYGEASVPRTATRWREVTGVTALPGPGRDRLDCSLGCGSTKRLARYFPPPVTARAFMQFITRMPSERRFSSRRPRRLRQRLYKTGADQAVPATSRFGKGHPQSANTASWRSELR